MDCYEKTCEWVKFLEMDLTTAEHLHKTMHPEPLEIVCYHCQQSAEKMLKAFLVFSGISPPRIHNLEELLGKCYKIDGTFSVIEKKCIRLSDYSSQPRYPNYLAVF